ncbi:FecCD family ABC transporter permease [Heyndrickxia coagulans]|uniref:Iron complex transport system permease protein n=1 Tax=Heyndrickxia coagulans DSM 1 = ATCC 7050 TaxID=1121088 RepID=A0A8B4BUF4_HEYCO|nr:iron ABC transporter permease [Heyndrickxia coagulans]AJH77942.1 fecCD transport family protein [Heyndrickxia coagulans DSM 1 = ATCC 7050]MED4345328.1 iron ABC transporter permease [Heyndrickxia coagulans]SHF27732.1 iron complex transport system permease protein [Heyndrickxia coagulans DSM 1 = ATCC 7050]
MKGTSNGVIGKIYYPVIFLLICMIAFSAIYSVSIGTVHIPIEKSMNVLLHVLTNGKMGHIKGMENSSYFNIIYQIRMPRVIFALLIGMGLSLCGIVMQAVVQNPLADPYIIGISSGGTLGATIVILIGFVSNDLFGTFSIAFGAFMGAMATSVAVLLLSSVGGKATSVKLVLSGVVVGALCSSFSSLVIYFANNAEGIKDVTFWTMGSLASASWEKVPVLSVVVLIGSLIFLFQHRVLNTMLLGDESAVTLGIHLSLFRKLYMVVTALITGTMVAYAGTIGFVGLIIPHICRGIFGADHKQLLPATILSGGLFLIWADILSRILIQNVELPIGIITSVIGSPLFIYMIVKKGYQFGG